MLRDMDLPTGSGRGAPGRAPLARESRFGQTSLFAPAVLGTAAACAWVLSISQSAPALRIVAGLLGAAASAVVVLREVTRSRAHPERMAGTVIGVILTVALALQAFAGTVPAFLVRAFGPRALGVPITWAAAAATAILLGPPLVAGGPSLVALNLGAMRLGALGARARLALWLVGAVDVPDELRADRNRARAALAWLVAVMGGWIAYTAWRGI
jgi:hypothetical protein